jgi:PAS domain S-box-containing protein
MEHEYSLTDALRPTGAVESSSRLNGSLPRVAEFRDRSAPGGVSGVCVTGSEICWLAAGNTRVMTVLQTMWDKAVIVRMRARGVLVLGTVLASLLLVALPRAHAVDPERHISQYGHTAWRIQDGFFEGVPYAIKQTADGYLWIGGANGLVRFDGVRFVPFTPPPGRQLPAPVIGRILAARDGSLWIGTMRGLSHWTNKDLINYPSTANAITAPFVEDEDGTIWFLRAAIADDTGPLCQVKDTVIRCYGKADGIPEEAYANVVRDSAGNFWLGSSNTLTRWRPGSFQTYYLSGLKANAGAGLFALAPRPDGSLWVGMADPGPAMGLQQLSHAAWKPLVVPGFDSSTLKVQTLFMDNQNALWVGTFEHGVYRIYGQGIEHFDSSEGLSGDAVFAFFEDREGNLWVATDKGLDCFRDLPVISLSSREGLTTPSVSTVQAMRDGSIWIGGAYALNILGPGLGQGRVRSLQTGKGLPGDQVTSLFEDHAGRHWVGIENTLNTYENGRFTRITRRDGSPMGMVLGITEDVDNNLWVLSLGPPRMLIRIFNRKVQEEIPTPQIPGASSIVADPRGGVWLGLLNGDLARYQQGRVETFRFEHSPDSRVHQVLLSADGSVLGATTYGLIGWSNGKQQTLSARNGLPCDGVYSAVKDDSDVLWLYMQCGLVEIARSDLQRWWAEPNVKLQPRVFDVFDGFQGGNRAAFESKAVRAVDGRLWFANAFVAQTIDPAHLARNVIAPAVHVEQVIADRKSHSLQGEVRLPALTRDLEIDYTALSFVVPQKVHFQYKLEGYDRDWQDAGTRRQAFYSNLPPRNYTFRVKACNNSGLWNEAGASLDFYIAPAYYQTNWFRLSCVAVLIALLWALHRWRVHQLKSQEKRLRDVVETIPTMTFTALSDGSSTFVNKRWTEYTGLSVEQSSGAGWQCAVHPEDLVRHSEKWRISVATGQLFEDEARFRCVADGEYRWFLVRGVPLRDQHGNIVKWYGTLTDIEDRKRAEHEREKLRELEADLAHINRVSTLGEMAASLAHEIKQPIAAAITSANSCIEWLAYEPPNLDRARAAAAKIDKYGNRAAEIIDRIRSFYKKSPPQRELVEVNGIIQELLALLKCEADRYSVAMRAELAAELPKIMADPVQLQQVFVNLMLNAIEAMQDSGGELTVSSELQEGQLQFSVSDRGMGLPKEKMDQIFSAFFTTKPQGSGMGLAISRSIVESHGGRLWATANDGRGATFHFTLPVQVTESSPLVA